MAGVVRYRTNDDDVREAFFQAVDAISSSSGRARTLIALLDRGNLDTSSIVSLTRSTRSISSSTETARVLIATAPSFVNEPTPRDAFLEAVASLASSGDHARVLLRETASGRARGRIVAPIGTVQLYNVSRTKIRPERTESNTGAVLRRDAELRLVDKGRSGRE